VPVHVVTNPPIGQDAELGIVTELARASALVDQLTHASPNVVRLLKRIGENSSAHDRTVIEDQLLNEFEAALYQGGVSPAMVPVLAEMLERATVSGIRVTCSERGESVVVYFLCKTVRMFYELGQMVVSGFMHAVFAVVIESVARTTVNVYIRADEFKYRFLCVCSPRDKGLLRNC